MVAAVAGGTLWQAKLPAPIPTLIIGAVYWVAAEGASRVNLDELIVRTSTVQETIIISCGCRVVMADSITWLYFVNSLTSGAHWMPSLSISVNPTMGAAILWWQAAVLGTVRVKCNFSTLTFEVLVSAEVPAFVTILATGVFTAGVAISIGLDMLLFFVWANPIAGDSGEVI